MRISPCDEMNGSGIGVFLMKTYYYIIKYRISNEYILKKIRKKYRLA